MNGITELARHIAAIVQTECELEVIYMSYDKETKQQGSEEALQGIGANVEDSSAARIADLETSNKELEAFSYSVAHDLRAPVRHMKGYVALLTERLEETTDQESLRYAAKIAVASNKMSKLIDDLLDFSRIGYKELQESKVNLNSIITEVIQELQEDLKEREIRWEIDELPDAIGDKALLRLVIMNLISNAVKFTSTSTQAEIRIGCKAGKEEFTCFIEDNGVGFDLKHVDRLFGVFQRLHTQEDFEGTGIGLANVQRIIARHGGRVWGEGAVGQGATFYFALPKDEWV